MTWLFNKEGGLISPFFFILKEKCMGKKKKEITKFEPERWEDEDHWWIERYIRMSEFEIRRANNGGGRYKPKKDKAESK